MPLNIRKRQRQPAISRKEYSSGYSVDTMFRVGDRRPATRQRPRSGAFVPRWIGNYHFMRHSGPADRCQSSAPSRPVAARWHRGCSSRLPPSDASPAARLLVKARVKARRRLNSIRPSISRVRRWVLSIKFAELSEKLRVANLQGQRLLEKRLRRNSEELRRVRCSVSVQNGRKAGVVCVA
jgi:hypothetical protein